MCVSLVSLSSIQVKANEETKEVDTLKKDYERIEADKSDTKKNISEINLYIDETEKVIMGINNTLNETNEKISASERKINSLIKKLEATQKQINIKTIELKEQKIKLGQTIAFMYENQNFGFFQFFFQTEHLSDFLKTYDFIGIVADENEKIYEKIQEEEKELIHQKEKLENDRKVLETSKLTLNNLKILQEGQIAEQNIILSKHRDKEIEMLNKLKEEEEASNQIMMEINKVLKDRIPNKGSEDIPLNPNQTLVSPLEAGSFSITSVYGYRTHPVLGYSKLHEGIDMAAEIGTKIYSAGTGTVLFSGPSTGFGNWIVIQEDNGLLTIYGHMDSGNLYVLPGERVTQGQVISLVGNSGLSSGPHLHFSVATSFDGSSFTYIDPLTVLK